MSGDPSGLWLEAYEWCGGDRDLMWDWLEALYLGVDLPPRRVRRELGSLLSLEEPVADPA